MNEQYLLSLMAILITLPFHGHHIVKAFKAKGKKSNKGKILQVPPVSEESSWRWKERNHDVMEDGRFNCV